MTTIGEEPAKGGNKGMLLIQLGFFSLALFFLISTIIETCEKEKDTPSSAGNQPTTATATRQTFLFADAKSQEVFVNVPKGRKPHFYPKGGQINICPPAGNCYVDTPGVDIYPVVKMTTGVWKITPSSQTATGVEVWLE